jgi:hypothetical protein
MGGVLLVNIVRGVAVGNYELGIGEETGGEEKV